jgi:hypothetical protein
MSPLTPNCALPGFGCQRERPRGRRRVVWVTRSPPSARLPGPEPTLAVPGAVGLTPRRIPRLPARTCSTSSPIRVDSADEAAERKKAAGGSLLVGPPGRVFRTVGSAC